MEKFGSGIWYSLHSRSIIANTREEQIEFCDFLLTTISLIPCDKCYGHATDYIENDNPRGLIMTAVGNTKPKYAMFKYMYKFHSAVNKRVGKPNASWIDVYEFYKRKARRYNVDDFPDNSSSGIKRSMDIPPNVTRSLGTVSKPSGLVGKPSVTVSKPSVISHNSFNKYSSKTSTGTTGKVKEYSSDKNSKLSGISGISFTGSQNSPGRSSRLSLAGKR